MSMIPSEISSGNLFCFLTALTSLVSLATGCTGTDNACSRLVNNNDQGYFIVGRVTSERVAFAEYSGLYQQADGLEGVSIRTAEPPEATAVTDSLGCFVLPVEDATPSIVIATLGDNIFLAATRAMFLSDDGPSGTRSRFLEIRLPAQGLVRFTPRAADQENTYFSLERVVSGKILSITLKASEIEDHAWAFAGIGPGYYRLTARLPSGDTVYYPNRSSREDGEILAVGLEPVELGSWDLREAQ